MTEKTDEPNKETQAKQELGKKKNKRDSRCGVRAGKHVTVAHGLVFQGKTCPPGLAKAGKKNKAEKGACHWGPSTWGAQWNNRGGDQKKYHSNNGYSGPKNTRQKQKAKSKSSPEQRKQCLGRLGRESVRPAEKPVGTAVGMFTVVSTSRIISKHTTIGGKKKKGSKPMKGQKQGQPRERLHARQEKDIPFGSPGDKHETLVQSQLNVGETIIGGTSWNGKGQYSRWGW